MRSSCRGISFVEAVVVISLVGIVAAFAIPRFLHLESDVRASEVVALGVNLRSVAALAHAQYVLSGSTLSSTKVQGRTVRLQNGYPDASSSGIQLALADLSDFTANATATSVTFSKTGAPNAAQCAVTYRVSPMASAAATTSDLHTSGC
jgi:MSHA pilin protein MshA